jgi:hypothetical protein
MCEARVLELRQPVLFVVGCDETAALELFRQWKPRKPALQAASQWQAGR